MTGYVKPGELLVIMGASGAGKTTLLNVLNFRTTGGLRVTGERCLNGVAVSPASLTSVSAYIQQDDLFISTLTVREHLIFQARLRMHSHIPYKDRLERVEYVIKDVNFDPICISKEGSNYFKLWFHFLVGFIKMFKFENRFSRTSQRDFGW